jgi:hypothetical protein
MSLSLVELLEEPNLQRLWKKPLPRRACSNKPSTTSSPPRPAKWARVVGEEPEKQRLRLTKTWGLAARHSTHSLFPSPPRQAERGEEGRDREADRRPAPRSRTESARPPPPPNPPSVETPRHLPKPPWPDRGQQREKGRAEKQRQQTPLGLFKRAAACSSHPSSNRRSEDRKTSNPKIQIRPARSQSPLENTGRRPDLQLLGTPAPLLHHLRPAAPPETARDRPSLAAKTLKLL